MPSNKPWLDGPTPKQRAAQKMWQGGPVFVIGALTTAATHFLFGFVLVWLVVISVVGLFWFLTGLLTYLTGLE